MDTKHIIALVLLLGLTAAGMLATIFSQKLRDVALFVLIFGAVFVRKFMDVTFAGDYLYRGTIRGLEVSALDIAAWCILLSTLALPRYRGKRWYMPAGLGTLILPGGGGLPDQDKRWYMPAGVGLLVLYFLYCAFNVAISDPQRYGLWELSRIFRGVLVLLAAALFVRTRRELSIVVVALSCAVWFLGLNAIEQRVFKGVIRPPATLDHENSFSMYLCTVAPVLLAAAMSNWAKWLRYLAASSVVMATVAEVLTLSRAGLPTFFFVMFCTALFCTTWRITRRKVLFVVVAFSVAGTALFAMREQLIRRMATGDSGLSMKDEFLSEDGYETRGVYWRLAFAIAEDRPYGVGLNNWSFHVSKSYAERLNIRYDEYDAARDAGSENDLNPPNHAPPAHSLAVITWGELGMPGLVIFALLWLRWFQVGASFLRGRLNADPMHRLGIGCLFSAVGIFLTSITEWTYRQTSILFTFHVIMGCMASLYYLKRQRKFAPVGTRAEEGEAPDFGIETRPIPVPAIPDRR